MAELVPPSPPLHVINRNTVCVLSIYIRVDTGYLASFPVYNTQQFLEMSAPNQPPPPSVPDGWLAKYDSNYKTYYYVDLSTGKSQWEAPAGVGSKSASGNPPAYSSQQQQPQPQQQANRGYQGGYAPQQSYGPGPGAYGGAPGYGGYPQGGGGYYPQQAYPQQQPIYAQQQQQPARRSNWGGAAMGAGAGLLGGMLIGDMMSDHGNTYIEENNYGGDPGYDGGYDDGGGFDGGGGDW